MSEIKIEDYEQYWQKGGTYVLPVEVFNDLFYDIEQLQQENKEFKEFKEEHKIMKQLLIEHGLWETLLNDDRFLNHLRNDNENYKSSFDILTEFEKWLEEEIEKINDLINPKNGIKPYGEELNLLETIRNVYMDCKDELQELKDGKKLQGE